MDIAWVLKEGGKRRKKKMSPPLSHSRSVPVWKYCSTSLKLTKCNTTTEIEPQKIPVLYLKRKYVEEAGCIISASVSGYISASNRQEVFFPVGSLQWRTRAWQSTKATTTREETTVPHCQSYTPHHVSNSCMRIAVLLSFFFFWVLSFFYKCQTKLVRWEAAKQGKIKPRILNLGTPYFQQSDPVVPVLGGHRFNSPVWQYEPGLHYMINARLPWLRAYARMRKGKRGNRVKFK